MRAVAVIALGLSLTGAAARAGSTPIDDAQRWVALVDADDYDASWLASGTIFQLRVTKDAWASAVGATRKPLGAVLSRKVLKEQQSTSLPGVPDGEYDVIQFTTEFANKKAAVETIVLAHEPAGWRVDGYFVR